MITLILNSMEGPLTAILAADGSAAARQCITSSASLLPPPVAVSPPFDPFAAIAAPATEGIPTPEQPHPVSSLALLKVYSCEAKGQGAEVLVPAIYKMLKELDVDKSCLTHIAAVRGPGSFTGIRLLLTTAFGLSRALPSIPLMGGLDYLPILAHTAAEYVNENIATIWVLTHARRGQVNLQGFAFKRINSVPLEEELVPIAPALYTSVDNAAKYINMHSAQAQIPAYATGTGLYNNMDFLGGALPHVTSLPEEAVFPSPCSLLYFARKAKYTHNPIEPLYLRDSEAEENLPKIAATLGIDPDKAREDLLRLTGKRAGKTGW